MADKKYGILTLVSDPPTKMMVHDGLEIQRLISKAAGNLSQVLCQISLPEVADPPASETRTQARPEKVDKYRARIVDYSRTQKVFTLSLPERMDLRLFAKKNSMTRSRPWLILIFLKGQIVLGVHAAPHFVDSEGVQFKLPERLFKMQRRARERFEIPSGYEYMVEMRRPGVEPRRVRRKLLNLSTNGFAFRVVTSREAALFKPGALLKGVTLSLQGTEVSMDVEVRNHLPNRDGGAGYKVGVKIVQIATADQDFLEGFLLSQMSQFVT
ncbi:MAG: PilZ domain-containing protein [Methylotenera sp.]|nr:PilZ domain-containing protein [Oligoflexia bacterium]